MTVRIAIYLLAASLPFTLGLPIARAAETSRAAANSGNRAFPNLPLYFEENVGQTAPEVQFLSRGPGYTMFLTPQEVVLSLRASDNRRAQGDVRLKFLQANPAVGVRGRGKLPGVVNYFRGGDPEQWKTGIRSYERIVYEELYSGIDLVFYGNPNQLEYDFVVAPGADPGRIRFDIEGAQELDLTSDGDLLIKTVAGELRQKKPVVYQEIDGRRVTVDGAYALANNGEVEFALGPYDRRAELVIDPVLVYATFLGGSGGEEVRHSAVDATGSYYATGITSSADFPATAGAYDATWDESLHPVVYVAKLNPTGTAFDFITFVGGGNPNSYDEVNGLDVDPLGNVYVGGRIIDSDSQYPTTPGAYQETCVFGSFLTKLNASGGSLAYSTCFSTDGTQLNLRDVAVDAAGNLYAVGTTAGGYRPGDFPASDGAFRSECTPQTASFCDSDVFVIKLNATGSGLAYATLLGRSGPGYPRIAVDSLGYAYVAGSAKVTNSTSSFPTTPGAFQPENPSQLRTGGVGFVSKLNLDASDLLYSTFLGGEAGAEPWSIAVDSNGNAIVTARSSSDTYPTTNNAFSTTHSQAGESLAIKMPDVVVSKLNAQGSALLYSTYLNVPGSASVDYPWDVAIAPDESIYVVGDYSNGVFPVTETIDFGCTLSGGVFPAFVSRLDPNAETGPDSLVFSLGIVGGSGTGVSVKTVAIDPEGGVYLGGATNCPLAPTTDAADTTFGGGNDGFLWKLETAPLADNQAPVAVDDAYQIDEDNTLSVLSVPLGVLGNDTDPDEDALNAVLVDDVSNGNLTLGSDGSINYAPASNFNGSDSFTYKASDGELDSNVAAVSITVNPVNDDPTAMADGPFFGVAGQPVTMDASASSDIESSPLTYSWDFGDGAVLNTSEPVVSHTYDAGGVFNVLLRVNDGDITSAPFGTQAEVAATGGGGQRADVDGFLAFVSPVEKIVAVPAGTAFLEVRIVYGSTILPETFVASLNRQTFAGFNPLPGTAETVAIPLDPEDSRTVLTLQVDGLRSDGKAATDRDRLTVAVE